MSSQAGLHPSRAVDDDLLARWMPSSSSSSSSRAGVIFNPSPGLLDRPGRRLVECPGDSLPWCSASPGNPDDSFASSFSPLPAAGSSTNSSSCCIGVDVSAQSEGWTEPEGVVVVVAASVCPNPGPAGVERTVGREEPLSGLKCGPTDNAPHDRSLIMKLDQVGVAAALWVG